MAKELTYVIATDRVLRKGVIGHVVQELPSDLELVAARMFTPSHGRIMAFAETITPSGLEVQKTSEELKRFLAREYVEGNPAQKRRALFLGLYGGDARA